MVFRLRQIESLVQFRVLRPGILWLDQVMVFTPPYASRLEDLSQVQLIGLVTALREGNAHLLGENRRQADAIAALTQQVEALERRLALNSRNSSKPPSGDGPSKPNARDKKKGRRGKSGRKPGGQPGHKGTTLKQTDTPDEVVDHHPKVCPDCQHDLTQCPSQGFAARQVFDLPPPPPLTVTEHRAHTCTCPGCGKRTRGDFPEGVKAPVQYGDHIAAMASYLQTQHCIPDERLSQIFRDLFGVRISAATLARLIAKVARGARSFTDAVRDALCGAQVVVKHLDETGLRVEGRNRWQHVICSLTMSHFRMGVGRGDLLSGVSGIVVHDNWASYGKMENVVHGLCNAHHLRELQALVDIEKEAWAAMMQVILLDAKKAADTARENGRGHVAANVIKVINERYDACIAQGLSLHENQPPLKPAPPGKATRGRPKRRTGHNLVLRLRDRKADVLRFLTDLRVPFTNNEAERDLRMGKVRIKVSGCFRTPAGAENFCTLRTVIETHPVAVPLFVRPRDISKALEDDIRRVTEPPVSPRCDARQNGVLFLRQRSID